MPNTDDITPIARPIFSGGNSSRMIPNASGKVAAPVPWSTRQATSQPRESPAAAPNEPRPKIVRHTTSSRFLPYMSPSLPSSGVSTEELNKKPVTSHVVSSCDVPNSWRKNGSAGIDERLHDRERDARHREKRECDPVPAHPTCRRWSEHGYSDQ